MTIGSVLNGECDSCGISLQLGTYMAPRAWNAAETRCRLPGSPALSPVVQLDTGCKDTVALSNHALAPREVRTSKPRNLFGSILPE